MKYSIDMHEFSFNKIKNGSRKIGVYLLDKKVQAIKLHDILDLRNTSNDEHLECMVKGIAIFDNFDDLVNSLGPQPLGYDNKEEVMIRLNRLFSATAQQTLNAVAFFIEPQLTRYRSVSREELER